MGMYTELYLSVEFKKDLPRNIEAVIQYMFGENQLEPTQLPEHEFFKCDRWSCIGRMASFYFIPFSTSNLQRQGSFNSLYLTMRCDLKNYNSEIEKFLDWVMPYIDAEEGDHLGHYRYEQDDRPTLIFFRGRYDITTAA